MTKTMAKSISVENVPVCPSEQIPVVYCVCTVLVGYYIHCTVLAQISAVTFCFLPPTPTPPIHCRLHLGLLYGAVVPSWWLLLYVVNVKDTWDLVRIRSGLLQTTPYSLSIAYTPLLLIQNTIIHIHRD